MKKNFRCTKVRKSCTFPQVSENKQKNEKLEDEILRKTGYTTPKFQRINGDDV